MMNERTEENITRSYPRAVAPKSARFEKWPREGLFLFARLKNLFWNMKKKNAAEKPKRDVKLLERFWKMKDEDRKIEDIPAAELNENISLIFKVRVFGTRKWPVYHLHPH